MKISTLMSVFIILVLALGGACNSEGRKGPADKEDAKQADKSLKQAAKAHEEGDYRTAPLQIRLPLAEEGSAEAQHPRGLDVLPRIWR